MAQAGRGAERPLAAIPLLFAVQQFAEGWLWLSFDAGSALGTIVFTQVYSVFSHVLWPVYVPLAAWCVEPPGQRRRLLAAATAAAGLFGVFMAASLVVDPITATVNGLHIEYAARHEHTPVVAALYLAATAGTLAISSHAYVRLFGLLAFATFIVSYVFYTRWFISVWCFFAAVLSLVVYLHFASRTQALLRAPAWSGGPGR